MLKIESIHIGKVRNSAILNNETRIIETTNRISAFDFIFPFTIKNKAKILQTLSVLNFQQTEHIIENHLIGVLDHSHLLVKNASVFPVEIIVRGYLAGSLWRLYEKKGVQGVFDEYGVELPTNMKQNQKLDTPILTPSTKPIAGHDLPISCKQAEEIVGAQYWPYIEKKALELFQFGQEQAEKNGLILVDTKYEMALYNNKVILVDEIHTPDSSRYWYKDEKNMNSPTQISKEFLREELIKILGKPEELKENPIYHPLLQDSNVIKNLSDKVAQRYEELFTLFTKLKNCDDIYKNKDLHAWPIDKEIFKKTVEAQTLPQKILVVGNGGRDYVLCSEIAKLTEVNTVYCAAGNRNWKDAKFATCSASKIEDIAKFAQENNVGLVVAGPEAPIAQGLEQFCAKLNIPVLAPTLSCASLESSKIFCKQLIEAAGVKTAPSKIVPWHELKLLLQNQKIQLPCVVKYDSLAAGKGVFILKSKEDVQITLESIEQNLPSWKLLSEQILTPTYSKKFGEPCFLIEEMIEGEEFSAIALCNGEHYRLLPIAKDYKRRNNNQQGPNTGGMGSVAPVQLSENLLEQVKNSFAATLKELVKRNTPYTGFLFAGFMVDKNNCAHLLEYNCRLGDPETQVVLPSLGREFYAELYHTAKKEPFFAPEKSGTFFVHDSLKRIFIVGASPEYPEQNAPKRKLIHPNILSENKDVQIEFIPSAIEENDFTTGGRAFGILSAGKSFESAKEEAYKIISRFELQNEDGSKVKPHFRTDIGV
ncbi:MAG: phosphoribosylaminoimidazolesuccinocarboxamide synthase [Bdellovibrionota bacterium]